MWCTYYSSIAGLLYIVEDMSTILDRSHLKDINPLCGNLSEFIYLLTEFRNVKEVPFKLEQLSRLPVFQVHLFKNINSTMLQNRVIVGSQEVLECTFEASDKPLIQDLFKSIGEESTICMLSLEYYTEELSFVVATSLFAMSKEGCYISYVAVIERDLVHVTEDGCFWNSGIASFLVRVIQLVSYVNYESWHIFCWSNNKKKKKDLWYKLGFVELQLDNNAFWPERIEEFANLFHLPQDHALKSKLCPKAIFSTISSFDITKEMRSLSDLPCDESMLSLHYYKDSWFDFSALLHNLTPDDPRTYCIQWLQEDIDFTDVREDSPMYSQKIFYIFSHRLKLMTDTICRTGYIEDLKEISDMEGYMSEICMDYCMMLMFFHVPNIFPISTQVFTWWNSCMSYNEMKDHFHQTYLYADCNVMEDQGNNKAYKFIIPFFQGVHFRIIVRRWIDDVLYFFYNDSNYKTQKNVVSHSTQFIPYEVFGFLMNSPLWPIGATARWIRVPSKEQEESECGFRCLLHAYILVTSENPLTCLLPLNYIGSLVLKKTHVFYQFRNSSLPFLCRTWLKDMMYAKKWVTPQWINVIENFKGGNCKTKMKPCYYLELQCSDKYENEVKEIVLKERKQEAEEQSRENEEQLSLLVQKSLLLRTPNRNSTSLVTQGETVSVSRVAETLISETCSQSIEDRNSTSCTLCPVESNTETHDVESHSTRDETPSRNSTTLVTDGETASVSRVPETLISEACTNSIEGRHSTSCTLQAVENGADLTQIVFTTNTHDVESQSTKSSIISKEAKRTKLSSNVESSNESSCNDSVSIPPWQSNEVVIDAATSDNGFVLNRTNSYSSQEVSSTDYGSSVESINESTCHDSVDIPPWRSNKDGNSVACNDYIIDSSRPSNASVHDLLSVNKVVIHTSDTTLTRIMCDSDELYSDNSTTSIINDEEDEIEKITPTEDQPPLPDSFIVRREKKSNLTNTPVYIDDICPICNRPVCDTYSCVFCTMFIHDVCGFMQYDGHFLCIKCHNNEFNTTSPTNIKPVRRLRRVTMKDTELSNLWSVPKPRKAQYTDNVSRRVVKLPPMSRELRTKLFNQWLSGISFLLCKPMNKGRYKFYGCHSDFQNVQEIYSTYLIHTLFENEKDLLDQLCAEENQNKWCDIPVILKDIWRARGECYSNDSRFASFDKLEQHQWSYMKLCTFQNRKYTTNCQLVDLKADFKAGTYHISLADSARSIYVNYVPRFYLCRWHRFCEKFKSPSQVNDFDNLFRKASNNPNKWVRMDAGRFRCSVHREDTMYEMTTLPTIYRKQTVGESSCVFASLISALHYIHDFQERDLLLNKIQSSLDFNHLASEGTMNRENYASKILNRDGKYKCITIKSFDILQNRSMWPTLCILKGSDGSVTHAVTVVNNYIFDSSCNTAMHLTKENLDWCCGSDYGEAKFVAVEVAHRFVKYTGSSSIFIRDTDEIQKAIMAFIRLFLWLGDQDLCMELEQYRAKYKEGEDFYSTIVQCIAKKPYSYLTRKVQFKNLADAIRMSTVEPLALILSNENECYRVITACGNMFFDGSKNPPFVLSEIYLKSVLRWDTSLDNISIVKGYSFIKKRI